jgi:membrane-associated phospholipid phosphatase
LQTAEFFRQHGPAWSVPLFRAVTFFGDAWTLGVLGCVVALILMIRRRWSLLFGWAASLFGTGQLNIILKGIFQRIRPQLSEPWVAAPGWSFPSGHAMGSFVTYGFLTYLILRLTPRDFPRRTAIALMAILVFLIGFSRIYLGVHYLSDVVAGFAAAVVWLGFCVLATEQTQRSSGTGHRAEA